MDSDSDNDTEIDNRPRPIQLQDERPLSSTSSDEEDINPTLDIHEQYFQQWKYEYTMSITLDDQDEELPCRNYR